MRGWMQPPHSGWECRVHSPGQRGSIRPCRKMALFVHGKDTDNPPLSQVFYCRWEGINAQSPYLCNTEVSWCQAAPNPLYIQKGGTDQQPWTSTWATTAGAIFGGLQKSLACRKTQLCPAAVVIFPNVTIWMSNTDSFNVLNIFSKS